METESPSFSKRGGRLCTVFVFPTTKAFLPEYYFKPLFLFTSKRRGRVIVNSLPFPLVLSTLISPFIRVTRFLVMAIPKPVPWILDTVVFLSLSKGSQIRVKNSSDIPIPLSLILKMKILLSTQSQLFSLRLIHTSPPSGV